MELARASQQKDALYAGRIEADDLVDYVMLAINTMTLLQEKLPAVYAVAWVWLIDLQPKQMEDALNV